MGRARKSRRDLPERVYVRGNWYCFLDRSNKWHRLGKEFGEAMRAWAEMMGERPVSTTIGKLMDSYLTCEKYGDLAERTRNDYAQAIAKLRLVFGKMSPEELEPKHVYGYMNLRKSKSKTKDGIAVAPKQAKTRANREVATLSAVMQHGVEIGAISINPCRSVKRLTERPRKRYVTDAEVELLRPHCPEWLQHYLDLKMLTGLRQGDMLALTKGAIQPDGLFVVTGKTKREILFSWSTELRATMNAINALRRKRSSLSLFPSEDATPLSQRGFKSAWARAMSKALRAGLAVRFSENDLRAKVGTDAHNKGQNATDLLGHENPATTRRNYIRGPLKVETLRKVLQSDLNITVEVDENAA